MSAGANPEMERVRRAQAQARLEAEQLRRRRRQLASARAEAQSPERRSRIQEQIFDVANAENRLNEATLRPLTAATRRADDAARRDDAVPAADLSDPSIIAAARDVSARAGALQADEAGLRRDRQLERERQIIEEQRRIQIGDRLGVGPEQVARLEELRSGTPRPEQGSPATDPRELALAEQRSGLHAARVGFDTRVAASRERGDTVTPRSRFALDDSTAATAERFLGEQRRRRELARREDAVPVKRAEAETALTRAQASALGRGLITPDGRAIDREGAAPATNPALERLNQSFVDRAVSEVETFGPLLGVSRPEELEAMISGFVGDVEEASGISGFFDPLNPFTSQNTERAELIASALEDVVERNPELARSMANRIVRQIDGNAEFIATNNLSLLPDSIQLPLGRIMRVARGLPVRARQASAPADAERLVGEGRR